MKLKKFFNISLSTKKNLIGYVFILPFIIGTVLFFLYPFFQAIVFSLSRIKIDPEGYELIYIKLDHYYKAFFVNPEFVRVFTNTIRNTLIDVPLIIFFSLFAAVLLNGKFRGRLFARSIFFLPVILGSGYLATMGETDFMLEIFQSGEQLTEAAAGGADESFYGVTIIRRFLLDLRFPGEFIEYIITVVSRIPEIIRASGVQILIFLAGLQSVPNSLYEASKVDGSTKWEDFWFITLPMISPLILTNIVYTIIDSFRAGGNELYQLIDDTAFAGDGGFGLSVAMANIYFFTISIILFISLLVISKWIYYEE